MKCILFKSYVLDDWYVVNPRPSDADVEGDAEEMRAIAAAIETGAAERFRRCAVAPVDGGYELWSPRNSTWRGRITLDEANDLAASIRSVLAGSVAP